MHLKIRYLRSVILCFAIAFLPTLSNATNSTIPICLPQLVQNFGLEGLDKPQAIELGMCPMIKASCCKRTDQLILFSNWNIGGESKALQARLETYYKDYTALIDEAVKVSDFATELTEHLKDRKISNCKVLARRVLHFQIAEIAPKLKEVVASLNDFFYNSYQGVYCAICDAQAHPFVKIGNSEIIFSKQFCRSIMANSLPFLLYFHIHFVKYLNLLIKFTTFCDNHGVFTERSISDGDLLNVDPLFRIKIEQCKDYHNNPLWFEKCVFICEKFNAIEYSSFFEPNLQKYRDTTALLNQLLTKAQHGVPAIMDTSGSIPAGKLRLLADKGTTEPAAAAAEPTPDRSLEVKTEGAQEGQEVYPKQLVIRSSFSGPIPVSEMKSRFENQGVNLYEYGATSRLLQSIYDNILAEVTPVSDIVDSSDDESSIVKSMGLTRIDVLSALCVFALTFIK